MQTLELSDTIMALHPGLIDTSAKLIIDLLALKNSNSSAAFKIVNVVPDMEPEEVVFRCVPSEPPVFEYELRLPDGITRESLVSMIERFWNDRSEITENIGELRSDNVNRAFNDGELWEISEHHKLFIRHLITELHRYIL